MSIINATAVNQWEYVTRQLDLEVSKMREFIRTYGETVFDKGCLRGLKLAHRTAKRNLMLAKLGAHPEVSNEGSVSLLTSHIAHTVQKVETCDTMCKAAKLGAKTALKKVRNEATKSGSLAA